MTRLRVAAVQLGPSRNDPVDNRTEVEERVLEAAHRGAELVVLPELALTPYFGSLPGGVHQDWASAPGSGDAAFLAQLGATAAVHLLAPFYERDPHTGRFHNSALLTDPAGQPVPATDRHGRMLVTDRKLHLPVGGEPACDEPAHFARGESLGVHHLGSVRLGCLICYDRRFPECWRELRALGAQVVAVPVAGSGGDPDGYFLAELRTHAKENGVVAIAANKVGTELLDGSRTLNTGDSCIIGADGQVLAVRPAAEGPGVLVADIDVDQVAAVRRAHRAFEHRRVDLFAGPPVDGWALADAAAGR